MELDLVGSQDNPRTCDLAKLLGLIHHGNVVNHEWMMVHELQINHCILLY